MSRNPHAVTEEFEKAIAEYTGAPYVVAVNSCTMALTLAVAYNIHPLWSPKGAPPLPKQEISIPKRTYVSVPMAIIHAGARPTFRDENWIGYYQMRPLPVWDSARWFSRGIYGADGEKCVGPPMPFSMFGEGQFVCVSFHASKTLGIEQGGAILHDDPEADVWFRKARFDGRTQGVAPKDDHFDMVGWHCYMNPSTAAQGILRLHSLPQVNPPLPNDDYPDLSKMEIFK
jgi:dTDP-4-amino-4,6-dideoxygalactose transaminase